jgi:MGT family glycosyltransferase
MNPTPIIALFPEASFGAALNCVGIAQSLRDKGARPVFICHAGFRGVFADYGFQEYHLDSSQTQSDTESQDYWERFIATHLSSFRLSPFRQIDDYVVPTWEAIVDTAIRAETPLRQLIAHIKPDIILLDNVIMFPAIETSGIPWVRMVSCAETEIPDPQVPPYLSGCQVEDREGAAAFFDAYQQALNKVHARYNDFRLECGCTPYANPKFLAASPSLNLMLTPAPVKLDRSHPLPPETFLYLEGCVRSEVSFTIPYFPQHNEAALIYLSFGSLGALDVALLRRLIDVFSRLPYRFIVNVGSNVQAYGVVPDNVFLGAWFPQPSVVSQIDLFIHHGGNNSFCEALYFGVPSLIMPYCWDGHDNAARVSERNLGDVLPRDSWSESELKQVIASLVEDSALRSQLIKTSTEMRNNSGRDSAANAILQLALGNGQ